MSLTESVYLGWGARRCLIFLAAILVGGFLCVSFESYSSPPTTVSVFQGHSGTFSISKRHTPSQDSPPDRNMQEEYRRMLRLSSQFLPNYKNPCWIEALARGQWGLRCLPYFYIAGIPKCGTTDLYNSVILHPDIAGGKKKEPQWWGRKRHKDSFDTYLKNFDPAVESIQRKVIDNFHPVITVDGSPSTAWFLTREAFKENTNNSTTELQYVNAHFLRAVQPDARIVIALRNPTDRMYSDYMHFEGKSPEDFHLRMTTAVTKMNKCISSKNVKHCAYTCTVQRLNIGLYYVYLKDWLDAFPPDQIFIIQLEEYATNRTAHLLKIFQFLGLSQPSKETMTLIEGKRISNTRKKPKLTKGSMLPETKLLLDQFYNKYNVRLANLLGDKKFLWQ